MEMKCAWGTIGNASTSEGLFFETINAAGVLTSSYGNEVFGMMNMEFLFMQNIKLPKKIFQKF